MNILTIHTRYFLAGGDDRQLFNVSAELTRRGHQVIPLAIRYSRNRETPYSKYFIPPPVSEDQVFYRELTPTVKQKVQMGVRAIYHRESVACLNRLLDEHPVDVAYVIETHNNISPSVFPTLKQRGIPIVMQVADFNLICPAYALMRDGHFCDKCLGHRYWNAVRHRCLQGSAAVSSARALAMWSHHLMGIFKHIDVFIAPAQYTRDKLIEGGLPAHKFQVIPYFVDADEFSPASTTGSNDYILYMGRLSPEKGIGVLVEALGKIVPHFPDIRLEIVGGSDRHGEKARLEAAIKREKLPVLFRGHLNGQDLVNAVRGARFTVVPSLWPDNAPFTVYEAMAVGKAIVGSKIGGIAEQIRDGVNGLAVPPGDVSALAAAMGELWSNPVRAQQMGQVARDIILQKHTPDVVMPCILAIFEKIVREA